MTGLTTLYEKIAGNENQFSFEHRIFNLTSFVLILFCILGTAINYSIGLHIATVWLSVAGIAISAFLFYTARIRELFGQQLIYAFTIAALTILGPMHFFNGASSGTIIYLLIMLLNIFLLIAVPRHQPGVYIILAAGILSLLLIEYFFPELVYPYRTRDERMIDHITVLFYSLFITMIVIRLFRRSYDREQATIIRQKKELEEAYLLAREKNHYIEALIRELHHRVKNNLQVVSSLLALQSNRLQDETARRALEDGRTRVDAMALVHQKLFLDNELSSVNLSEYLRHLGHSLSRSFGYKMETVNSEVSLTSSSMDIDKAIPIGLIVNELVTNAFKHAFRETMQPLITVSVLEREDGCLWMQVVDNGSGFDTNSGKERPDSLGLKLVQTLVDQLNGSLRVEQHNGTIFTIEIRP